MLIHRQLLAAHLFAVALVVAVVPDAGLVGCRGVTPRQTADFAARGPHGVGFRTLHSSTRHVPRRRTAASPAPVPHARHRGVVPRYHAAGAGGGADAPLDASGGPYPLILYGHALKDTRAGEAYLDGASREPRLRRCRGRLSARQARCPGRGDDRGYREPAAAICGSSSIVFSPATEGSRAPSTPSASGRAACRSAGGPCCSSPIIATSATAASVPSCRSLRRSRAPSRVPSTGAPACRCSCCRATRTSRAARREWAPRRRGMRAVHGRSRC